MPQKVPSYSLDSLGGTSCQYDVSVGSVGILGHSIFYQNKKLAGDSSFEETPSVH